MLEIAALYFLCKHMGTILRSKGWNRTVWMQLLVVLAWFGSMFAGSFLYTIFILITKGETAVDDIGLAIYPVALISALIGVGVVFLVAKLLPSKIEQPEESFVQKLD